MKAKVKFKSNAPLVIKKGEDAGKRIAMAMAARIMTTARGSLARPRKDGKPSEPGRPPRASKFFKSQVRFAYDPITRTVVIGPKQLEDRATKDAPEALELGKSTTRIVPDGKRSRRRVRATYAARPFMVPAFEKRIGELPSLWKNAIRN